MRQRLIQFAAAASFTLCLLVHLCWLRSYFWTERVDWTNRGGAQSVRTAAGHLVVDLLVADWSKKPTAQLRAPHYERGPVSPPFNDLLLCCHSVGDQRIYWEGGGFAWYAILNFKEGQHDANLIAPCWFLAAATMVLPLAVTTRRLWSKRSVAAGPSH